MSSNLSNILIHAEGLSCLAPDSFLDYDKQEKERGLIFSNSKLISPKQPSFTYSQLKYWEISLSTLFFLAISLVAAFKSHLYTDKIILHNFSLRGFLIQDLSIQLSIFPLGYLILCLKNNFYSPKFSFAK